MNTNLKFSFQTIIKSGSHIDSAIGHFVNGTSRDLLILKPHELIIYTLQFGSIKPLLRHNLNLNGIKICLIPPKGKSKCSVALLGSEYSFHFFKYDDYSQSLRSVSDNNYNKKGHTKAKSPIMARCLKYNFILLHLYQGLIKLIEYNSDSSGDYEEEEEEEEKMDNKAIDLRLQHPNIRSIKFLKTATNFFNLSSDLCLREENEGNDKQNLPCFCVLYLSNTGSVSVNTYYYSKTLQKLLPGPFSISNLDYTFSNLFSFRQGVLAFAYGTISYYSEAFSLVKEIPRRITLATEFSFDEILCADSDGGIWIVKYDIIKKDKQEKKKGYYQKVKNQRVPILKATKIGEIKHLQLTSIQYLDSGLAYLGSKNGNSYIIDLKKINNSEPYLIENNLATITDLCVLPLLGGLYGLAICSSSQNNSNLIIMSAKVSLDEMYSIEMNNLQNFWNYKDILFLKSYQNENNLIIKKENEIISRIDVPNMNLNDTITIIEFQKYLLNITNDSIMFLKKKSFQIVLNWKLPTEYKNFIILSSSKILENMIALYLSNNILLILKILNGLKIEIIFTLSFHIEISCLYFGKSSIMNNKLKKNTLIVGLWDNSVQIFQQRYNYIHNENHNKNKIQNGNEFKLMAKYHFNKILPRSISIINDYDLKKDYLIVGFVNGLIYFLDCFLKDENEVNIKIIDIFNLGVSPISLDKIIWKPALNNYVKLNENQNKKSKMEMEMEGGGVVQGGGRGVKRKGKEIQIEKEIEIEIEIERQENGNKNEKYKTIFASGERSGIFIIENNKFKFYEFSKQNIKRINNHGSELIVYNQKEITWCTIPIISNIFASLRKIKLNKFQPMKIIYEPNENIFLILAVKMGKEVQTNDGKVLRGIKDINNWEMEKDIRWKFKICKILVISNHNLQIIDEITLNQNEIGNSIISFQFQSKDTQQQYFIVGTTILETEKKKSNKGRILILSKEQTLDPKQNKTLKVILQMTLNGSVFSMKQIESTNKFLVGVDCSWCLFQLIHNREEELQIQFLSQYSNYSPSLFLDCEKDIILSSDKLSSITVSQFKDGMGGGNISGGGNGNEKEKEKEKGGNINMEVEEEKEEEGRNDLKKGNPIFPIAKDFNHQNLTAISIINSNYFLIANNKLNLIILSKNKQKLKKTSLKTISELHLAEKISVFKKLDSKRIIYGTLSGSIGLISIISNKDYKFMLKLQQVILSVANTIGLNYNFFRNYDSNNDSRFKIIDLDLITKCLNLSEKSLSLIVKKLNKFIQISKENLLIRIKNFIKAQKIF
ncbi:DNA repair/RNA processing cpsf family [Anaeramoeba flamelloides]|uniref:DNA repair/RNA processing cpsf family n=1 Tax=Anaeramoeba flamelloides TaxID=1746091 RepID=A0ABQ8YI19_9EUKA|nr:DNA repair/RNA processing cpsf family [Anaeramoeba flamelloides]